MRAKGGEANAGNPKIRTSGKETTANTRKKRNSNNLTDDEQKFADLVLKNPEGKSATDLLLSVLPNTARPSARVKASNWLGEPRIRAYMDKVRAKVEAKVEYDLVKWRLDVLELIEISMGRKERPQAVRIENENGDKIMVQLPGVKEFEGAVAKGALELIAKQMGLLKDKVEVDVGEKLRELFSGIKPTLGPPAMRTIEHVADDD